mgnify:CR=1 FL=1
MTVEDAPDVGTLARQILEPIHLLLTDVVMPGPMNGRRLAEEALKRRSDLKVLFTSGYTENAIVHHGRLDPGVLLYLLQARGLSAKEVERLIYKKSGLLGISGQVAELLLRSLEIPGRGHGAEVDPLGEQALLTKKALEIGLTLRELVLDCNQISGLREEFYDM